jgi:hypothetical protein
MCKWNVFTIDREMGLCKDEALLGKIFSTREF